MEEILKELREIKAMVAIVEELVRRHDKSLYGNGREGIVDTVRRLDDAHKRLSAWRAPMVLLTIVIILLSGASVALQIIGK